MIETWEADSLSVRVDVTSEATGTALDLGAASVEAFAENEEITVVAFATIEDAAGGVIRVQFEAGALPRGVFVFQVRVTIGSETQTVVSGPLRSKYSVGVAA